MSARLHYLPKRRQRQLHLNANVIPSGRHDAAWRQLARPNAIADIDAYLEIARIAERGTFDALFFADHLDLIPSAATRPVQALDPVVVLTAMAGVTRHIGLVATASTTYEHPYTLARRFASFDHATRGRAAWNIVTTMSDGAARLFGEGQLPPHDERYRRAHEFVDVVTQLWDSWDDDAIVADATTGRYIDFDKVHPIDHAGPHFRVAGALNVPRTPQGRPVIVQAGASAASRRLGARWADALFTVQRTVESGRAFYAEVKALARSYDRDPDHLLVLPGLYTVVGSTEAEAHARKAEMDALLDVAKEHRAFARRFGVEADDLPLDRPLPDNILDRAEPGSTSRGFIEAIVDEARSGKLTVRQVLARNALGGHRLIVGTPEQIADDIELWFTSGAADGFNLNLDSYPSGLALFVDHVVPELRRRGLFRTAYSGSTLRDHLGLPRHSTSSRHAAFAIN